MYFYAPNGQLLTIANVSLSAGQPGSVQMAGNRIYFGSMVIGTQTPANQTYGDAGFALNNVGSYSDTYPYGTIIKGSVPSEQTPAFATYSADNSTIGLYYANQRWYSPSMGRFATADPDPNSGNAANPLTLNLYNYSGGDPISQNDPLGTNFGPAGFCPIESWDSGFGDDLWGGTDGILWNCNNQFAGVFVDVGLGVLIGLGIGGGGGGNHENCEQEYPVSSQPEAQELAVLFGEDSWNLAPTLYDYDSVATEDLYMLQAMYNQAAGRSGFDGTPAYVASTISAATYRGYPRGRGLLSSAFVSSPASNACAHLISTEETYTEFWDGSHDFSNVNQWRAASTHGTLQPGDTQIAGTVFFYQGAVVPRPPHYNPPIRVPRPIRRKIS